MIINKMHPGLLGKKSKLLPYLKSYYTFDANTTDCHGSNNANLIGGAIIDAVYGKINAGVYFDSYNDQITFNNHLFDDGATEFSFSLWVHLSQGIAYVRDYDVVGNYDGTNGWIFYFDVTTDTWKFIVATNSGIITAESPVMNDDAELGKDEYIHYMCSYLPTGYAKIYKNGVQLAVSSTSGGTLKRNSSYIEKLGMNGCSWNHQYSVPGYLDEFATFNKGLELQDAQRLYNEGNGLSYANF